MSDFVILSVCEKNHVYDGEDDGTGKIIKKAVCHCKSTLKAHFVSQMRAAAIRGAFKLAGPAGVRALLKGNRCPLK